MADEEFNEDGTINNKVEKRIKDLSEKVRLTSEERDEKDGLLKTRETELATANKERDFFKDFASSSSRYPNAAEYQDAIKEKVMAGYSVEDATVSILAKEGKLQNYTPPAPKQDSPAGGSATNQISTGGDKSLKEMSREEKRAALMDAEDSEGGVSNILRRNL